MSVQRRVIAESLDGEHRHVTADELWRTARGRMPEIGRATVYKALDAFVASGQVRELRFGPGPAHFDPNGNIHHDHLVCQRCERVWDVAQATAARPDCEGFSVEYSESTHYGVCDACRD